MTFSVGVGSRAVVGTTGTPGGDPWNLSGRPWARCLVERCPYSGTWKPAVGVDSCLENVWAVAASISHLYEREVTDRRHRCR